MLLKIRYYVPLLVVLSLLAPMEVAGQTLVDHFTADDLNAQANGHVLANGDWTSAVGSASANVANGNATLRKNAVGSHSVVNFDGNDALRIINGAMAGAGDFTVAVVYRTNSADGTTGGWWTNTSLVDSEEPGHTNDWGLNINSSGQLAAGLGNPGSGSQTLYSSTSGDIQDGLAHVAVYTRNNSTIALYVDGASAGSAAAVNANARNITDYYLGRNPAGISHLLTGDIAEVRVYDNDLNSTDAVNLSNTLLTAYTNSNYATTVLGDGPSHYYRLGEGTNSAASAYDEVATNHGAFTNAPTVDQPGGIANDGNTAVQFDGSNDFVRVVNDLAADFSLECCINTPVDSLTGSSAWHGNGIIWSDVAGAASDLVLSILNNTFAFHDGHSGQQVFGTTDVTDGQWHHVAVTRDAGATLELFVDGLSEDTAAAGTNPLTANPNIDIGANTLDGRYFNGLIDEVAFYNSVLTSTQVGQHYAVGIPEPSTFVLAALGLLELLGFGWRRTRRTKDEGRRTKLAGQGLP